MTPARALCALLACLLMVLPGTGTAQQVRLDARLTQACLDRGQGAECIGLAAEACMAAPGGYSTVGMVGCVGAEHDWWDAALNTAYRRLRAREVAADAGWQPIPGQMPRPSTAGALRDAQRLWIDWRDATCRYEELQWWGGSGASLAGISCRMRLTAEQALTLRGYLGDG
jgi:uncharacterized protein YecT (DUF1311 family)